MSDPIIALDVSKGSSHMRGFKSCDDVAGKGKSVLIRHDKEGLGAIVSLAGNIAKETGTMPKIVLESTGIYSSCVIRFCRLSGLQAWLISPLASAKVRKAAIRPTKTDAMDTETIAEAFYTPKSHARMAKCDDGPRQRLFELSRIRESEIRIAIILKNEFRRCIDDVWPGLDELFPDVYSSVPMLLIRKYKHPETLARQSERNVAKAIFKGSFAGESRSGEFAEEALRYAKSHVSGEGESSPETDRLARLAGQISSEESTIANLLSEMKEEASKLPEWKNLSTVPCLSGIIGLNILAEIGDISFFGCGKSLVAYAGLDPAVMQSGTSMTGRGMHITKKGNSSLRKNAYLAVMAMLRGRPNAITRFYEAKKSGGLPSKAAAIAACNKLLRIICQVLAHRVDFSEQ